jgi:hypothetical protein
MRSQCCDYCRAIPVNYITIQHLFGIMACDEHKPLAKRDNKAWLGRRGMVKLKDAQKNPELEKFLNVLDSFKESGFHVLRSDGALHKGWILKRHHEWDPFFFVKRKGSWLFPAETLDRGEDLTKGVELQHYLRDDLAAHFPEGFKEIVQGAIDALNAGFYNEEVRMCDELAHEPNHGHVPDIPMIRVLPNGVRVFDPDA